MLFGSFCSFVYAGFALELFWFLAKENTDFLFPYFAHRFFQVSNEGFAQDFTIASVTGIKFFPWQVCVPCNINPAIPYLVDA